MALMRRRRWRACANPRAFGRRRSRGSAQALPRDEGASIRNLGRYARLRAACGARDGCAGIRTAAPRTAWPVALVLLAVLAAGCGGGGGPTAAGRDPAPPPSPPSSPTPVPPAPVAPGEYAEHPEYKAAWGLDATNAAVAYGRIAGRDGKGTAPGAGARVSVIDTGIDDGHWEFDGLALTGTGRSSPDGSHGTAVSSVIAAGRDGSRTPSGSADPDFHGLAWGIGRLEVKHVALSTPDPDRNYTANPRAQVDDRIDWLATQFSGLQATADFVNMSFGVHGLVENYGGLSFGPLYPPAITTLAQTGRQTGKTVLVIAAGNDHGRKCRTPEQNCVGGRIDASSPTLIAGLPVLEESLRRHVVAVVATDRRGRVASFSNRCGVAAKWCIAAPGVDIPIAYSKDGSRGYATASGTSLAAPHVTGGLAVMKHWFRGQLANEDLLARLYSTARMTPDPVPSGGSCPAHLDLDGDLGDCELSSELGRGLMDLGAATAPVGTTSIVLGGSAAGGGLPAMSSRIAPGGPVGDALRHGLAGHEIAVFDRLGAPFWIDAARFVQDRPPAAGTARLSRWLDGAAGAPRTRGEGGYRRSAMAGPSGNELRVGFGAPSGAHVAGLVSGPAAAELRLGSASLSTFGSTGSGGEAGLHAVDGNAHGLAMSWEPADDDARVRAGWIGETNTFLGSTAEGAFGRLSSDLLFVGAAESFEADGWRFGVAAEFGWATLDAAGGMFAGTDTAAYSSAFSAEIVRPLARGTLRLSLEQPLRIENGSMEMSFPAGRTPDGAVASRRIAIGLEPSGRQLDFGIDWTGRLGAGAVWRVGAVLSREPGHDADRDAEATFLAGLRFSP